MSAASSLALPLSVSKEQERLMVTANMAKQSLNVFVASKEHLSKTKKTSSVCEVRSKSTQLTSSSPLFRRIVAQFAEIFVALQQDLADINDDDRASRTSCVSRASLAYRSVLVDACRAAQQPEVADMISRLEAIWSIVDVLVVRDHPTNVVLPHLLQWVSSHCCEADSAAKTILEELPETPERHRLFWSTIQLYLLQGRCEQAYKLFLLHSDSGNGESLLSLEELLRKMPQTPWMHSMLNKESASVYSQSDFEYRFGRWHSEVERRIEQGDFVGDEDCRNVANLLAGSDAFFCVSHNDRPWYEWMLAKLLYCEPGVKMYDLSAHAERALALKAHKMTSFDSIIVAAMDGDVQEIMHELCSTLDSFWFPAHLLDLLHHAKFGQENNDLMPGKGLREFLICDYASTLAAHTPMWQTSLSYLDYCPSQGRRRQELLLERIPVNANNAFRTEKVIDAALQRKLDPSLVSSVCRVMARQFLQRNQLPQAMTWAIRAQDPSLTTFLADALLRRYASDADFSNNDLIDALQTSSISSLVLSDSLIFLAKYRDFVQLVHKSEWEQASHLLHSLIASRLAPKYFWPTLIMQATQFLTVCEDDDDDSMDDLTGQEEKERERGTLFSADQTFDLLHCLQMVCQELSELPSKQGILLKQNEKRLRRLIADHLARALMDEAELNGDN